MPIQLTHDDALIILQRKVNTPGALQVITATHQCLPGAGIIRGANGKGVPSTEAEAAACAAYGAANAHPAYAHGLADPAHFVCLDVVRLDGPDDKGRYTALAADGSYCQGYPANLLAKLTEAPARAALPEPE